MTSNQDFTIISTSIYNTQNIQRTLCCWTIQSALNTGVLYIYISRFLVINTVENTQINVLNCLVLVCTPTIDKINILSIELEAHVVKCFHMQIFLLISHRMSLHCKLVPVQYRKYIVVYSHKNLKTNRTENKTILILYSINML